MLLDSAQRWGLSFRPPSSPARPFRPAHAAARPEPGSGAALFSLGRFWADATPASASTAAATVDSNTVFICSLLWDTPRDANCVYSVGKRRAGRQVPITGAIAAVAIAFPVPAGHASPIGLIQRTLLAQNSRIGRRGRGGELGDFVVVDRSQCGRVPRQCRQDARAHGRVAGAARRGRARRLGRGARAPRRARQAAAARAGDEPDRSRLAVPRTVAARRQRHVRRRHPRRRHHHRHRPRRGPRMRDRLQRLHHQGRHLLPDDGEEASARAGDRAREPAALHLSGRFRRRQPAAPDGGVPRPRAFRPHLLQPGDAVGRRHPADRRA